jgi:hypothetical protein
MILSERTICSCGQAGHLKFVSFVFGLLVVFILVLTSAQGAAAEKSVKVVVTTDKQEFYYGEDIVILASISNSMETMCVLPMAAPPPPDEPSHALQLLVGGRGFSAYSPFYRAPDAIVLSPGESVRVRLSHIYLPPGRHDVSVMYSYWPEEAGQPDAEGFWRGRVVSEPIRISVSGKDLRPEDMAKFRRQQDEVMARVKDNPLGKRQAISRFMYYMPLTTDFMQKMLVDPDSDVRRETVNSIDVLAQSGHGDGKVQPYSDTSLLPAVLRMAKSERHYSVVIVILDFIQNDFGDLDDTNKALALEILESHLAGSDAFLAERAARAYLEVNPRRGAAAMKKLLAETKPEPSSDRADSFRRALLGKTGVNDIQQALDKLMEQQLQ